MIKRMIKCHPTESDAKASKGVPGLTDDQGASDRKSDAKASKTWDGSLPSEPVGRPMVKSSGLWDCVASSLVTDSHLRTNPIGPV